MRGLSFFNLLVLLTCAFLFTACPAPEKESDDNEATVDTVTTDIDQTSPEKVKVKELMNTLPGALHIASMFKKAGLSFKEGLALSTDSLDQYISKTSKSLNMGVYTSDLAYTTFNGQTDLNIKYLKAVRELADDLGMSSIFQNRELIDRFEENLGQPDSLINILHNLDSEKEYFLKETNRMDVVTLIFAGAWVESMYLGTQIATMDKNNALVAKLIEQKITLETLLPMLEDYSSGDEDVQELFNKLSSMRSMMEEIAQKYGEANIDANTDFKMEDVKELAQKLASIRSFIISQA